MAIEDFFKKKVAPTPEGAMADDSTLNKFKRQENSRKLVAWVKSEYERAKQARKQEELDWYLQLAFYNGNQYHEWSKVNNAQVLREPLNPQNTPRIVVNRIEPIIRTEIAKTSSGSPSATVVPASNDDDDLMAAQAAEQVWQAMYDKNNFQTDIIQKSEFWRATCANAFIKTFWDPTKKEISPKVTQNPFTVS